MVKKIFNDNRDFRSVKKRRRQKMDLTFLIRRLRNRGKNGFEAIDEMNRSVFLDLQKLALIMIEKQHYVWKFPFDYRDLRFYNRDYPGSDRDPGGFFSIRFCMDTD